MPPVAMIFVYGFLAWIATIVFLLSLYGIAAMVLGWFLP